MAGAKKVDSHVTKEEELRLTTTEQHFIRSLGIGRTSASIVYRDFDLETIERMERAGLSEGGVDPIPSFALTPKGQKVLDRIGPLTGAELARSLTPPRLRAGESYLEAARCEASPSKGHFFSLERQPDGTLDGKCNYCHRPYSEVHGKGGSGKMSKKDKATQATTVKEAPAKKAKATEAVDMIGPSELAERLGCSPQTLRKILRKEYPRDEDSKGQPYRWKDGSRELDQVTKRVQKVLDSAGEAKSVVEEAPKPKKAKKAEPVEEAPKPKKAKEEEVEADELEEDLEADEPEETPKPKKAKKAKALDLDDEPEEAQKPKKAKKAK